MATQVWYSGKGLHGMHQWQKALGLTGAWRIDKILPPHCDEVVEIMYIEVICSEHIVPIYEYKERPWWDITPYFMLRKVSGWKRENITGWYREDRIKLVEEGEVMQCGVDNETIGPN